MSSDQSLSARHQALQAAAAQAQPPRPRNPRPIVNLGAGGIVRNAHLPAYRKAGFPVIALADAAPGRAAELAREFRIEHSFDSVAEAIRFAPKDAIFDIAVPATGLPAILEQLPQGAAVVMQKPMGETFDEARAIRALCRERGLTAAVNFQLRFAPNNLGAVALAQAGALGTIHDLEVQTRTYTPWSLWTFLSTAPRLEILYHSIHYLDLIRAWLGNPQGVYAKTVRNPLTPHLAPTSTSIILDYGDDKRVSVITNHGHQFEASQCSFVQWEGEQGTMRIDMGVNLDYPVGKPDTLSYALRGDDAGWQHLPVSGNWFPDAFIGSMGSLQAFVEGSATELPTSFESAFETMALVEAAYRSSAKAGEPLPLD